MGTQVSPQKKGTGPNFRPVSVVAKCKWLPISATAEHLLLFVFTHIISEFPPFQ